MNSPKYAIQSDLLYELLTYGDGLTEKLLGIDGNWSIGHEIVVPKAVLTWLAEQAFLTRPMPWQPDTCFSALKSEELIKKTTQRLLRLIDTDPQAIRAAVKELRTIRRLHQQWVRSLYKNQIVTVSGVECMSLGRAYLDEGGNPCAKYASRLYELKVAAEALQLAGQDDVPPIRAPHDLLTSWKLKAGYSRCNVLVQTLVPLADILCSAPFHQTRDPTHRERGAIERGEFIVLTRNLTGLRTFKPAEISIENGLAPEIGFDVNDLDSCRRTLEVGFPINKCATAYPYPAKVPYENLIRELPWYKRFGPAWKVLRGTA